MARVLSIISQDIRGVPGGYAGLGASPSSSKTCLALNPGYGKRQGGVQMIFCSENREEASDASPQLSC